VTKYDFYEDDYESYEEMFNPLRTDRQARRKRKPKTKHTPKKSQGEIIAELAQTTGLEGGFSTTYQPGLFEQGWLLESLRQFYDMNLLTDVLARVKGGKEANVYRCAAHPTAGVSLLAAKVYRPRMFRNLRNDKVYREGRPILKSNGKVVKETDHRVMRAIGKKSAFGEQVSHTSWLMYEYTTLERLYQAGAAVPKPFAAGENAIMMGFCGDEQMAAPALNEVALEQDEAKVLFAEVLRNIEIMLQNGLVHGDLSAYNILYWEGSITLIDFPQVTSIQSNTQAYSILARDITRVCDYFLEQGVMCDAGELLNDLWRRYVEPQDEIPFVDE
jgi:RIO kinase 1